MTLIKNQRVIASDPRPRMTAREILEHRLGRDIGPIRDMPRDTRRALYQLVKGMQKLKGGDA